MKKNKFVWLVVGVVIGVLAMVLLQALGVIKPSFNNSEASDLDSGAGICITACERSYNHCALYVSKDLLAGGPSDMKYCNRLSDACNSGCEGYGYIQ